MKNKLLLGVTALALIAAPIAPASAHGWHGGPLFALGAAVGAVAGAAVTVASLPFQAVGAVVAPAPVYAGPPPVAYPAPVYAGGYPGYYAPAPVALYGGYPGYYGLHYGYARVGYYGYGHRY